jgi:hypothetical protein
MATLPRHRGKNPVRRSVTLPRWIADRMDRIAEDQRVSTNRVLVDLVEDAIRAHEQRRSEFMAIAGRFQQSTDPVETEKLREELARMTFGLGRG